MTYRELAERVETKTGKGWIGRIQNESIIHKTTRIITFTLTEEGNAELEPDTEISEDFLTDDVDSHKEMVVVSACPNCHGFDCSIQYAILDENFWSFWRTFHLTESYCCNNLELRDEFNKVNESIKKRIVRWLRQKLLRD